MAEAIPGAAISAVNMSEVVSKLSEAGMPESVIRHALHPLGMEVVPFDEDQAYHAGMLRIPTKSKGLSMGNRACLDLAGKLGLPVLTADKTWTELSLGIIVRTIR